MAFYTGPLYHLEDRSENVENHNKLLNNALGFGRASVEERQAVLTAAHAWQAFRFFLPLRDTERWLVSFGKRRRLPRSSTSHVSHSENEYRRRFEIMKVRGRMCHARRWSSTSVAFARSSATIRRGMCPQHKPPLSRSYFAPRSFTRHWRSGDPLLCLFCIGLIVGYNELDVPTKSRLRPADAMAHRRSQFALHIDTAFL
jgi:hypothetical protein